MYLRCPQCTTSAIPSTRSFFSTGLALSNSSQCLQPPSRTGVLVIRSEKADFWQFLGGRGLPGGEEALKDDAALFGAPVKQENGLQAVAEPVSNDGVSEPASNNTGAVIPDEGFGKEMMGLTGGFPGGETGLKTFISQNPAPAPSKEAPGVLPKQQRPKAPPPPLLMPGMTVIVKNPKNHFYMYGGIVQRVTDGRVGVLFEGGNWDKLQTFYLEELERVEKGPPMVNPKSAILLERPVPPPR